jgi:hypothetical protein
MSFGGVCPTRSRSQWDVAMSFQVPCAAIHSSQLSRDAFCLPRPDLAGPRMPVLLCLCLTSSQPSLLLILPLLSSFTSLLTHTSSNPPFPLPLSDLGHHRPRQPHRTSSTYTNRTPFTASPDTNAHHVDLTTDSPHRRQSIVLIFNWSTFHIHLANCVFSPPAASTSCLVISTLPPSRFLHCTDTPLTRIELTTATATALLHI